MARVSHEAGFLLHARAYRETSALLEMLTRSHGRVGLVHRGAKRPRKGGASSLQPFCPLRVSWSGKGELHTLTGVEQVGASRLSTPRLKVCGLYLNELIVNLVQRNSPAEELYRSYDETLAGLGAGAAIEPLLRQFELYLLKISGYGPQLEHEAHSDQAIDPEAYYYYDNERGPVLSPQGEARREPRVSGRTLLGLRTEQPLDAESTKESKLLLRGIIDYQLRGKPLVSREIMKYFGRDAAPEQLTSTDDS